MTRIIAGTAGGRTVRTPPGSRTRPTSDRVREAIFSALDARGVVAGADVLDLYAGSGALGLEAASRGAASVVLIDSDRGAAQTIKANAAALGLAGHVRVVASAVRSALAHGSANLTTGAGGAGTAYDLVFYDPPYDLDNADVTADLAALTEGEWLGAQARLVLERSTRAGEPPWPPGIHCERTKTYGDTTIWYAAYAPCASGDQDGLTGR